MTTKTEFYAEEKDDYHSEMYFEEGELSFFSGDSEFSGYFHRFTAENTKQLYQAMRKYYGDL